MERMERIRDGAPLMLETLRIARVVLTAAQVNGRTASALYTPWSTQTLLELVEETLGEIEPPSPRRRQ